MADLIAWLDAQEQKPFSRVASPDAIVETFDPLLNRLGVEDFALPDRILEIYDRGQEGMEGRGAGYEELENGALQTTLQNLLSLK